MARRDLAGLAALGALALMANKGKKGSDVDTSGIQDMDLTGGARSMPVDTGELRDETGALSTLRRNTETGDLYSPNAPITRPRTKTPAVRSRPSTTTSAAPAKAPATSVNPIDELNRATNTKPMDPNSDRGPNAITENELDRNVNNALNALPAGSGLLRIGRNFARAKAEADMARASKLKDYITPEIGMSRPMLPRPGQVYGEGFVMNRRNGGTVKMAKGGVTRSSASKRADGIATKGKTRGRMR